MPLHDALRIIEQRVRDAEFLTQKAPALSRQETGFELDTDDELFSELMKSDQLVDEAFVDVNGLPLEKQLALVDSKFQLLIRENKVFREYLAAMEPYKQELSLMRGPHSQGKPVFEARVVVDALEPETLLAFAQPQGVDEIKTFGSMVPESVSKTMDQHADMTRAEERLEQLSYDVAQLAIRSARVLEKYVSEVVIEPNEKLGEIDDKTRAKTTIRDDISID